MQDMSTLTLMVCPHDTIHEPERWYHLEKYLAQKLGIEMQFEMSLDFPDFHANIAKADIIYANPTDHITRLSKNGYLPLVRPAGLCDEAVFITNTETANPTLESLQGVELATVKELIPTHVALHALQSKGIAHGLLHQRDSWQGVISSVWNGEVPYGIVYKDTYDKLSEHGKSMVNAFATTNEGIAYHTIDIGPGLADRKDEIAQIFLAMDSDEEGRTVLKELDITKWQPVQQAELDRMTDLMAMDL
jgi:ABC-type phosphate/phosphonate transport system substrate-binding protein